jgi:tetratricopeptide (TPR) repeat protein
MTTKPADIALKLIQSNRLDEAALLLRSVLTATPEDTAALHLLGTVEAQLGNLDAALSYFDRVLERAPRSAPVHMDKGNVLLLMGSFDQARETLQRAIRLNPGLAEAYANLGQVELQCSNLTSAKRHLETAVKLKANFPDAWVGLGNACFHLREFELAVDAFGRAIALQPDHIDALINRGTALINVNRMTEAVGQLKRAVQLYPDHAEAHAKLGNALLKKGDSRDAIASLDRALELQPNEPDWMTWRAHGLSNLFRYEEAIVAYDEALAIAPDNPWALEGKGAAFFRLNRFEDSLEYFAKTLALAPGNGGTHFNRANALRELKRFEEAFSEYDLAIELSEQNADIHFSKALLLLSLGRWKEAWPQYEWRWKYSSAIDPVTQPQSLPRWDGKTSLTGKSILLSHEQGFGDSIMIVRYAAKVAELGAEVWLWLPPGLERLLVRAPGVSGVLCREDSGTIIQSTSRTVGDFDFYCPMMSLPGIFNSTPDTVPYSTEPYLTPDPSDVSKWSAEIQRTPGRPLIGVMWRGQDNKLLHPRSITLGQLAPLLDLPADFVSLQKDLPNADLDALSNRRIQHFGVQQGDFADAAALIALCDAVVTIDTSIAHLAGALGKPTWIMLPYSADWRWLRDAARSVWYAGTTRLIRQSQFGDWTAPINQVTQELNGLLGR